MKGQVRLLELQQRHNWNRDTLLLAVVLLDDPYPFTLHFSAFIAVIEAQGTEEQIKEWIPPCERMEILGTHNQVILIQGCYAQTEFIPLCPD
jgi:acyl-CoA oxidase